MVTLYLFDRRQVAGEAVFLQCLAELPEKRQKKVLSYRFPGDQQLSLGAGLLLEFWRRREGLTREDFILSPTEKPELKPGIPLSFNLSHGGDYVLFSASSQTLGVDLEEIRSDFLEVADRYFTAEEQTQIFSQENLSSQDRTFFRLWTLKESYMKATGLGFNLPLHSFSIILGEDHPYFGLPEEVNQEFSLAELEAPQGYLASLCYAGAREALLSKVPQELSVEEILEGFSH